jgi:histidine triad (HIT) family protein
MENCIFCKIISGEIDSARLWEDDEFLAILDINPNTKGMTVLMTKQHYPSYAFELPDNVFQKFFATARKVAKILEKGLSVKRVALVMEGMGLNHAHLKLYPLHGLSGKFEENWAKEKIFFEKYQGYLTTQLGPQVEIQNLKNLAEEIKSKN